MKQLLFFFSLVFVFSCGGQQAAYRNYIMAEEEGEYPVQVEVESELDQGFKSL